MKRISLFMAAATAAVLATTALSAGVASAHHPVAVGQTACMDDGSWTVTWTVGNSETAAGRIMTFDSATVNGAPISLSPGSVSPGGSATGTSTHAAATDSVTLVVTGRWAYITPNPTASATATVVKPTDCVATTTTTTVAPTTTTVAASTTTAAQVADTTVTSGATQASAAPQDDPQVAADQATQDAVGQELPATGAAVSIPALVGGVSLLLGGIAIVAAARRRGATV